MSNTIVVQWLHDFGIAQNTFMCLVIKGVLGFQLKTVLM